MKEGASFKGKLPVRFLSLFFFLLILGILVSERMVFGTE